MLNMNAKYDLIAARANTGPVNLPADGHRVAVIRTDTPVFAAPKQAGAIAESAPQPAGIEPSRALDTKKATHPGHKPSRVPRQEAFE